MRKVIVIVALLLRCSWLVAESEEEVGVIDEALPRFEKPEKEREEVLIPRCRGIVLISSPNALLSGSQLEKVEGLKVVGIDLPGSQKELEKKLNPLYLGKPVTTSSIKAIRGVLIDYFQDHNRPLIVVSVPNQEIVADVLQIIILESLVGEVRVEGSCWSSTERLKKLIRLKSGDRIDQKKLLQDLEFVNRNPFRRGDLIYTPGKEDGTTDVILSLDERDPFRFYAGFENTGVPTTGRQRYLAGVNWGNVFGLGHIFGYQFTAAYKIKQFQAHTAQYVAPLPWRHVLSVYGGVAWVEANLGSSSMDSHGFSVQASGRYLIPLLAGINWRQEFVAGFDFKRTNNTVEFTDDGNPFGMNVNLTQFVAGYRAHFEPSFWELDLLVDLFYSPGKWVADQSNQGYETLRKGAKNQWVYLTGAMNYILSLPQGFVFSLKGAGQISFQNLLPSEQFGLGGYDTVRGYNEREVSTENGILLSTEVRSPPLQLFTCKKKMRVDEGLQFLVFLDYGHGWYKKKITGIPKSQYLLGVGPGLRYTLGPYLAARLDWGIKLHKKRGYGGGGTMVHFSVVGSY